MGGETTVVSLDITLAVSCTTSSIQHCVYGYTMCSTRCVVIICLLCTDVAQDNFLVSPSQMYDELYLVKVQSRLFNTYRFHWAAVSWQLVWIHNSLFIQFSHFTESVNWGNFYVKLRRYLFWHMRPMLSSSSKINSAWLYDGSWVIAHKEIMRITVLTVLGTCYCCKIHLCSLSTWQQKPLDLWSNSFRI